MEQPEKINVVRFRNVEFSVQGAALLDQQSKILSIAKKDIRKITLKYGFQSERPVAQAGFGVLLLLIGLYFIVNFILHILINRIVYMTMLLSILLLPVGIWFIVDGLRRSLYFEVTLDNDKRKLPLGKKPGKEELRRFIQMASQLGYVIDGAYMEQIDPVEMRA
jgi:hypothetical protein